MSDRRAVASRALPRPGRRASEALLVLGCLVVIGADLVAFNVFPAADFPGRRRLDLDAEMSLGVAWSSAMVVVSTLALLVAFGRLRRRVLLCWAGIFLVAGIDDLVRLHERAGELAAGHLGADPLVGVAPQDLGELAAFTPVGVAVLLALVVARRQAEGTGHASGDRRGGCPAWWISRRCAALLGALAFFAVGVDLLSAVVPQGPLRLVVIEDGGEVAVLTATALVLLRSAGEIRRIGAGAPQGPEDQSAQADHVGPEVELLDDTPSAG